MFWLDAEAFQQRRQGAQVGGATANRKIQGGDDEIHFG
jgi:hypothetical protein